MRNIRVPARLEDALDVGVAALEMDCGQYYELSTGLCHKRPLLRIWPFGRHNGKEKDGLEEGGEDRACVASA